MKILLTCILFLSTILSVGQNKHLALGYKGNGISIGNSAKNNGIRLNIYDKNTINYNGLNISGYSNAKRTNGVGIGAIAFTDSICNGFSFGLLNITKHKSNGLSLGIMGSGAEEMNGIAIGGLAVGASKLNGIGIAGLAVIGDTLNGIFLSSFGISEWNTEQIKLINGLTFGTIIGANTKKMNGVSLSIIQNVTYTLNGVAISMMNSSIEMHGLQIGGVNESDELYGIQFGLWNIAENSQLLRQFPLINFNFRKRKSSR